MLSAQVSNSLQVLGLNHSLLHHDAFFIVLNNSVYISHLFFSRKIFPCIIPENICLYTLANKKHVSVLQGLIFFPVKFSLGYFRL